MERLLEAMAESGKTRQKDLMAVAEIWMQKNKTRLPKEVLKHMIKDFINDIPKECRDW